MVMMRISSLKMKDIGCTLMERKKEIYEVIWLLLLCLLPLFDLDPNPGLPHIINQTIRLIIGHLLLVNSNFLLNKTVIRVSEEKNDYGGGSFQRLN